MQTIERKVFQQEEEQVMTQYQQSAIDDESRQSYDPRTDLLDLILGSGCE